MNAITKEARAKEIERLREIQDEMDDLLSEACTCLHNAGAYETRRIAERYWVAQITAALGMNQDLDGERCMVSMEATIEDLESDQEDDR